MTDIDLDALLNEAQESASTKGDFPDDYVTSTKKDGDLVPSGKADVKIAHVQPYAVTDWGTESVSLVLRRLDNGRSWWASLDFAVEGDPDRSAKSIKASMSKLLALGYTADEVKEMVSQRATVDWSQLLKDTKLEVNVKHNDSGGNTYCNTYFNKRIDGERPTVTVAVDESPAPKGEGNPLPSTLPKLGS